MVHLGCTLLIEQRCHSAPTKRDGCWVHIYTREREAARAGRGEESDDKSGEAGRSEGGLARGVSEVGGCYCYHCLNRLAVSRARLEGSLT